jgi:pentatricopeptide repeat protein
MKDCYREGNTAMQMRPDRISYSLLLNNYRQKMQIDEAEAMLQEMVNDFLNRNANAQPELRKHTQATRNLMP